ncbi:MAG TPA: TIM barrel protein [Ktedonobacterales bacterium]|nr:TIM barrel protein [Ktedonobacterales bacterium]
MSAFGDEIADDLGTQLDVLAGAGVAFLEFRGAWGKNVLDLGDDELARARALLDARAFGVSAVASPIGKSPLDLPRSFELERLERAIAAADLFGTRLIRIFSFYVPSGGRRPEARTEVLERLRLLAARAAQRNVTLVHENEKGIYGDTSERCLDLLAAIDSPALRAAFDPANFVQVGVHPMEAWQVLAGHTIHMHIKDARFADGSVVPPGQGDGEIAALLAALASANYQGFLTLEPHLHFAGPAGGYSGPEGMRVAIRSLRALLDTVLSPTAEGD